MYKRKVFKYTLPVGCRTTINIKGFRRILDVHEQRGQVCVWALIDDGGADTTVAFGVVPTGCPVTDEFKDSDYIGTVYLDDVTNVMHIFAVRCD